MKTFIYSLTIILTSLFVAPQLSSAETTTASTTATEASFGDGVKKRKFKTHKGNKRRKNTCLRKGGCKPKLRNAAKSKCGGWM